MAQVGHANKEEVFKAIYSKYYRPVVAHILRFGFDRETSRDLAQETFIRVYQGMTEWREDGALSYLLTTASRVALNELRATRSTKRKAASVSLEEIPPGAEPASPEDTVARLVESEAGREREEKIRHALSNLPRRLQGPLFLRLNGSSYKDISKRLGISLDTVKSRLHETKILLRRQQLSVELIPETED